MYRVTFVSSLFTARTREESGEVLQVMLDALARIDELYLRRHPETPALYNAGVKYMPERLGEEHWQDVPTTLARKIGDCEDLACWRAAELRVRSNINARPCYRYKVVDGPNGGPITLYHILVLRPDGSIEDPSKRLGMGSTEEQSWTSAP